MVAIRFTTFGATSAGGSFAPNDIMRCDEKLAKHLVEEAMCAVYLTAPQPAPVAAPDAEPVQQRRARRNKD